MYGQGLIYAKEIKQLFCNKCNLFLADRYVEGTCPVCKKIARGDQCDNYSTILDSLDLKGRRCRNCNSEPIIKFSEQLFFKLTAFESYLYQQLATVGNTWRRNALNATERHLVEGLRDRGISRDLTWGIEVPIEGYEDKTIYVWIEALLGYLTMTKKWAQGENSDWRRFWNDHTKSYYVHGKDNIPFHTIILPALLYGIGIMKRPDKIISGEFLTLEGQKISTSNNWAVWIPDIVERFKPDAIRYFLIANSPESRDADFSWWEFYNKNNGELLGVYGNLVNRTLVFVERKFQKRIPSGQPLPLIKSQINSLYEKIGIFIEEGYLKGALSEVFNFIRSMNKYFDTEKPWLTIKTGEEKCSDTIYNCLLAIINVANLLHPFLPFSSAKIKEWLCCDRLDWEYTDIVVGTRLGDFDILFERLDEKVIKSELLKLGELKRQPGHV